MQIDQIRRCGIARAGLIAILAGLLGACAEQSEPAPVFQKGSAEPIVGPMPPPQQAMIPQPPATPQTIAPPPPYSAAAPPPSVSPPPSAAKVLPEIIPLD